MEKRLIDLDKLSIFAYEPASQFHDPRELQATLELLRRPGGMLSPLPTIGKGREVQLKRRKHGTHLRDVR